MSFRNINFSNDYGNNEKEKLFDKICYDFEKFKGDPLGSGSYGSVYDLRGFDEFFKNNEQVVVKRIATFSQSGCVEQKSVAVRTKMQTPTEINAFYCEGDNTALAEYYISLATSQLNSENFVDTYIYKDCISEGIQYIFMEKIDTTFGHYIKMVNEAPSIDNQRQFDAVIVQILHGLWCLHTAGINHNDSKADNIFLKKADGYITKDGRLLQDFDYVTYDFGSGGVISIPVKDIKYIVKIGDFGASQKYSEPAVLTDHIYEDYILDYLSPFYDIMLAFSDIENNLSPLYKTIQMFILGFDESINFVENRYDTFKIQESWPKIKDICDDKCRTIKLIDNVISNMDANPGRFNDMVEKYYDQFIRCIFFNEKDANKDQRQDYNFKLSQMKNSDIDSIKIINIGFFKEQLDKYGWGTSESRDSLLFGGPGKQKFSRSVRKVSH
jgi:serine/threonine protein kinase